MTLKLCSAEGATAHKHTQKTSADRGDGSSCDVTLIKKRADDMTDAIWTHLTEGQRKDRPQMCVCVFVCVCSVCKMRPPVLGVGGMHKSALRKKKNLTHPHFLALN